MSRPAAFLFVPRLILTGLVCYGLYYLGRLAEALTAVGKR